MNINLEVSQTTFKEVQTEFDLLENELNGENVLILHVSPEANVIYHVK